MDYATYPWDKYPPYVMGGCYLISRPAIDSLLAAASTTPYFLLEDVYLSGLCAPKGNVLVYSSDHFAIWNPPQDLDPCFIRKTVSWIPNDMQIAHQITENYFANNKTQCTNMGEDEAKEQFDFKIISSYNVVF